MDRDAWDGTPTSFWHAVEQVRLGQAGVAEHATLVAVYDAAKQGEALRAVVMRVCAELAALPDQGLSQEVQHARSTLTTCLAVQDLARGGHY